MTVLSKALIPSLSKSLKKQKGFVQSVASLCSAPTKEKAPIVPHDADVVIIGGGSLGCQTQYHLAKLGITNTVLLEKDQLTAGSRQIVF